MNACLRAKTGNQTNHIQKHRVEGGRNVMKHSVFCEAQLFLVFVHPVFEECIQPENILELDLRLKPNIASSSISSSFINISHVIKE